MAVVFVFTTLEVSTAGLYTKMGRWVDFVIAKPILKPLMKTATTGLMAASGEVIDNHDQYEVSFMASIECDVVGFIPYALRFLT